MKIWLIIFLLFSVHSKAEEFKEISLNFKEAKTVNLLKIIANFSGKGIVLPESDLGVTTVYLTNVPWNEAINAIAKSENLNIEITKSLIVVSKGKCTTTIFKR